MLRTKTEMPQVKVLGKTSQDSSQYPEISTRLLLRKTDSRNDNNSAPKIVSLPCRIFRVNKSNRLNLNARIATKKSTKVHSAPETSRRVISPASARIARRKIARVSLTGRYACARKKDKDKCDAAHCRGL